MQEIKVWYSFGFLSSNVRLTKGEAKDAAYGSAVHEGILHYDGDLEDLLNKRSVVFSVNQGNSFGHFFFTLEEAINHYVEGSGADGESYFAEVYDIYPASYKPVELPTTVMLYKGDRGLCCRLNLHPEEDGAYCKGKIYFVDRSCTDKAREGLFVVTSVKDKGSYGFVSGYMKQCKAPSTKQVVSYIIENSMYDNHVSFCKSNVGDFAIINGRYFVQEDGEMVHSSLLVHLDDKFVVIDKVTTGADLVCEVYQDCTYREFKDRFVRFGFSVPQSVHSSRFISDLFDEAEDCGFVSLRSAYNVDFVDVVDNKLPDVLDQFSKDEVREIVDIVNKINKNANSVITGKIKSGKIPMLTRRVNYEYQY